MSHDKRTYSFPSHENLLDCKNSHQYMICYYQQPIYESTGNIACEFQLLVGQITHNFKECSIKILPRNKDHWTYLGSIDGWLYSVSNSTPLRITCSEKTVQIALSYLGILRLRPGCSARQGHTTLRSTLDIGEVSFIDESHKSLDISEIDDKIFDKMNTLIKENPENVDFSFKENKKILKGGESLDNIIKAYDEFLSNQRQKQIDKYTTYGTGTILITSLVISKVFVIKVKNTNCERVAVEETPFTRTIVHKQSAVPHPANQKEL